MAYAATADVYQRVTDQIIAALEAGVTAGDYKTPWNRSGGSMLQRPVNASTGKYYRGINVLMLWGSADAAGYSNGVWATYKQWAELGAQVRKGEKSTTIVFWKKIEVRDDDADGADSEETTRTRMMAKAYCVFNVSQVDGYQPKAVPAQLTEEQRDAEADAWFATIPAVVRHGGDAAFYRPADDFVQMPAFAAFRDGPAYYTTLAHELTHWSGTKRRLDRDLTGRFGDDAYAMEELVAEISASFVMAGLGISPEPRKDRVGYIASWLRVLKNDKRAIFTAAAKSQQAADFLDAFSAAADDAAADERIAA